MKLYNCNGFSEIDIIVILALINEVEGLLITMG